MSQISLDPRGICAPIDILNASNAKITHPQLSRIWPFCGTCLTWEIDSYRPHSLKRPVPDRRATKPPRLSIPLPFELKFVTFDLLFPRTASHTAYTSYTVHTHTLMLYRNNAAYRELGNRLETLMLASLGSLDWTWPLCCSGGA